LTRFGIDPDLCLGRACALSREDRQIALSARVPDARGRRETTGLSSKIWQKIMIIDTLEPSGAH